MTNDDGENIDNEIDEDKQLESTDKKEKPETHVNPEDDGLIPDHILRELPSPAREIISTQLSVGVQGRMPNPIASKLTPEHIDKIIDQDENEAVRQHKQVNTQRVFTLGYTLLSILAFFILYIVIGKDDPALFKEIITYFATFCAGFLGGWGYQALK